MAKRTSRTRGAQRSSSGERPVSGALVWWLRCLGVLAFVAVLLRLPSTQDVQLSRIDLRWLGVCMLLTVFQLLLEAFAWQWLLSIQRVHHPYPRTLVAYLASQYLGLVTPGHVGEYLAAAYVSSHTGLTVGYVLSSVVMNKILYWITVVAFGIWSLPLLTDVPFLHGVRVIVVASIVVLVTLSAGIGIWVVALRHLAKKWRKLSPWQIDMTEFWSGMRHLTVGALVMPMAILVVAFGLLFAQLDAVLHSLGIALPMVEVAKIVGLSRIAARLVPLSVIGFGAKDAALIVLLKRHGLATPVTATVAVLWMACSYLPMLLLSGLCWWIKPLVVRRVGGTRS